MKIRHPLAVKLVAFVGAYWIRLWIGFMPYRARCQGTDVRPNKRGLRGRYIYAFWHENMVVPSCQYCRSGAHVLISESNDGELIAETCRRMGSRVVRGSAARGGAKALLQMVRMVRAGEIRHLVVTPDGPRGPRRTVQVGLVYLAARTGLPIVPVGVGCRRAWRISSWDRFAVPQPWGAAACMLGEPIHVPPDVRKDQLEEYRLRVEVALKRADEAAERLAGAPARPMENAPGRRAA